MGQQGVARLRAHDLAADLAARQNVARVLAASITPLVQIGVVVQPHPVNGQPGAIFRDRAGKVLTTWALDIRDGQIQTIRSVLNPDKLGPVADPWAVAHEANQVRRGRSRAVSEVPR